MMSKDRNGHISDEVLIRAVSDGDMGAFAEIYKRYSPPLRQFVAGLLKNNTKAEDIVQNIFMRMLTSKPVFDGLAPFKKWLLVCARNEVVSILRTKWESSVEKVHSFSDTIAGDVSSESLKPVLDDVLSKMPPKRSEVFRLSRIEGVSDEDIAAHMGISVRTVQKHLEVASKDVKKILN